jgi:endogenous inhibitor of DNA gyrase (YacG/DUF329 family)
MTTQAYNTAVRGLSWYYGPILFGIMIPGVIGALYLSDRVAASSSWERTLVFLALAPVDLAPIVFAAWIIELTDRRIGLKCPTCGQSLSFGRHVRRLMRYGGVCPKCGTAVVDTEGNAEQGAPRNSRRAEHLTGS